MCYLYYEQFKCILITCSFITSNSESKAKGEDRVSFMNCACLRHFFFITTEEEQSPLALQEAVFMAAGVFQNLIVCAMMSCSNTMAAAIDKETPSVSSGHMACVFTE